jgi:hypothetical protein
MGDMGFFSDLVGGIKKAIRGGKPKADIEEVRSSGGLGPTNPTDAFDPLRPAESSSGSPEVLHGDPSVASGDPEEGGEIFDPLGPTSEDPPSASSPI